MLRSLSFLAILVSCIAPTLLIQSNHNMAPVLHALIGLSTVIGAMTALYGAVCLAARPIETTHRLFVAGGAALATLLCSLAYVFYLMVVSEMYIWIPIAVITGFAFCGMMCFVKC